ncbi:hypothetical protein SAMN04487768_3136 [Burkholderia sp. b13]|nr:hypothetical protein SAMN04487768_3136 [Burkholderia sp. b13]
MVGLPIVTQVTMATTRSGDRHWLGYSMNDRSSAFKRDDKREAKGDIAPH